MRLSAIVAMSQNRVIGKDNKLPWYLPADLKHFKELTVGKSVLMGRKTYESIGRPLPNRRNIVITRDAHFEAPGCVVVHSVEEALIAVASEDEVMVIGGAYLFEEMMPQIRRIYLTVIHHDFEGDVFFPEIDDSAWGLSERSDYEPDEKNPYPYSFLILERK